MDHPFGGAFGSCMQGTIWCLAKKKKKVSGLYHFFPVPGPQPLLSRVAHHDLVSSAGDETWKVNPESWRVTHFEVVISIDWAFKPVLLQQHCARTPTRVSYPLRAFPAREKNNKKKVIRNHVSVSRVHLKIKRARVFDELFFFFFSPSASSGPDVFSPGLMAVLIGQLLRDSSARR